MPDKRQNQNKLEVDPNTLPAQEGQVKVSGKKQVSHNRKNYKKKPKSQRSSASSSLPQGLQFLRLLWCDPGGVVRFRVVPRTRVPACIEDGVGIARCVFAMPSYADFVVPNSGLTTAGEDRLVPDCRTMKAYPLRTSHFMAMTSLAQSGNINQTSNLCVRSGLIRAIEKLKNIHPRLELRVGFESEFNILKLDPSNEKVYLPYDTTNYCCSQSLLGDSVRIMDDICYRLADLGIEVEQFHSESSHGQFELATTHLPALQACDNLIFTREVIRGVCNKYGYHASFLPKLFDNAAGNGCHMHFSLEIDETNVFSFQNSPIPETAIPDTESTTAAATIPSSQSSSSSSSPSLSSSLSSSSSSSSSSSFSSSFGLSEKGSNFMAAVLENLPDITCFLLPTTSSYARAQPGCWAGVYQCWGVENKEAPLRLCGTPPTNFELKLHDATTNPYMSVSAVLLAGLQGIEKKMKLPDPVNCDPLSLADDVKPPRLPSDLRAAVDACKNGKFYSTLSEHFGEGIMRSYLAVKEADFDRFHKSEIAEINKELLQIY